MKIMRLTSNNLSQALGHTQTKTNQVKEKKVNQSSASHLMSFRIL